MKNDGGEDVKVVNEPPNSSEMIYKILNMIKAQIGVIVGVLSILLICLVMYIFSASWQAMSFKGWLSIFITIFTVAVILTNYWPSSYVMFGGMAFCYGLGVVDSAGAFAGFSNTGVLTVALMFIVAKTVELSGILKYVIIYLLRKPKSAWMAQLRLLLTVGIMSMFINNTPVAIMFIPVVQLWSQDISIPASKLLLPMAYTIIIGGVCTTIGTSSNMVLVGLAAGADPDIQIQFFDTAVPGIPIFIASIIYQIVFSPLLLSSNKSATVKRSAVPTSTTDLSNAPNQRRSYTSAFRIPSTSKYVGKRLKETRLVKLKGIEIIEIGDPSSYKPSDAEINQDEVKQPLIFRDNNNNNNINNIEESGHDYLMSSMGSSGIYTTTEFTDSEIDRDGEIISEEKQHTSVDLNRVLQVGDILYFRGSLRDLYVLYMIKDIIPIEVNQVKKIEGKERTIVEVVVSGMSPVLGKTVREAKFRSKYNAVILSVHRKDQEIIQRIGYIELQSGDVLLLETTPDFVKLYKNSQDFLLVTESLSTEIISDQFIVYFRMFIIVFLLSVMIFSSAIQIYSTLQGTLFLVVIYVAIEAITWEQSLASLQANTLLVIACAFSLGNSMTEQGATTIIADSLIQVFSIFGRIGVLGGLFICTTLLCTIISNTAVVTIMFPIAQQFAYSAGISIKCVTITLMLASSCLFPSPLGYQVLMAVHAVGGYKFSDYLKFGIPLTVIYFFISVPIIYYVWVDAFTPGEEQYYSNQSYFP